MASVHHSPAAEGQPRYLPYASGSFRLAMGLQRLHPEAWIEADGYYAAELALKARLLAERRAEVFAALPESLDAQAELLDMLLAHLSAQHPGRVQVDTSTGTLRVPEAGHTHRLADYAGAPLDLAARLVQEDLCLMQPPAGPGGGYTLAAASVCFPARWKLAERFARPMTAIHERVPGYGEKLAPPVDLFFERLRPERPVWRLNWSVVDDPQLFQPDSGAKFRSGRDERVTAENAGERLWLRVERQTLRRLPRSGWIVFGIHTYVDALDTLRGLPEAARGLAAAVRDLPGPMRRYKSLGRFEQALLGWLDAVQACPA